MLRKILALTLLTVLLFGCAPAVTPQAAPTIGATQPPQVQTEAPTTAPTASSAITLTDDLGRTVTLNHPAQRIVSMAPSNTEILFAIGAGSQVVGRDDFSDYPNAVQSLPKVGGTDKYNNEQIEALQPDLVIAAEINTADQVKALEKSRIDRLLLEESHLNRRDVWQPRNGGKVNRSRSGRGYSHCIAQSAGCRGG